MKWLKKLYGKRMPITSHSSVGGGKCSASAMSTKSSSSTAPPEKMRVLKCTGCGKKLGFYYAPYIYPFENMYCKICAKIKKLTE
jgi:hypothetical protein